MINRYTILSKLPSFKNKEVTVVKEQDTTDLINSILKWHKIYQKDYLSIAPYFQGNTQLETLHNIFDFLKSNIQYFQEPAEKQTLRSPSAIVALAKNDCKNYALFIGGILGALNTLGDKFNFVYRFASYSPISKTPGHVFIVVNPGTKREVWVDPVLDYLNDRNKEPYYFQDKKVSNMIVGISGIGDISFPQPPQTLPYNNSSAPEISTAQNISATASQLISFLPNAGLPGSLINTAGNVASQIASGNWPGAVISAASAIFKNLFGKPEWQNRYDNLSGQPVDVSVLYYLKQLQSGAYNVNDAWQLHEFFLDAAPAQNHGWPDRTNEVSTDVANVWNQYVSVKFPGYPQLIIDLNKTSGRNSSLFASQPQPVTTINPATGLPVTTTASTTKAGLSTFVTIGLVGAAVLFFANKKR